MFRYPSVAEFSFISMDITAAGIYECVVRNQINITNRNQLNLHMTGE